MFGFIGVWGLGFRVYWGLGFRVQHRMLFVDLASPATYWLLAGSNGICYTAT